MRPIACRFAPRGYADIFTLIRYADSYAAFDAAYAYVDARHAISPLCHAIFMLICHYVTLDISPPCLWLRDMPARHAIIAAAAMHAAADAFAAIADAAAMLLAMPCHATPPATLFR